MTDFEVETNEAKNSFIGFSRCMEKDLSKYSNKNLWFVDHERERADELRNKLKKPDETSLTNHVKEQYQIIINENEMVNTQEPRENEKSEITDITKYKPVLLSSLYSSYKKLISTIYKIFGECCNLFYKIENDRIEKIKIYDDLNLKRKEDWTMKKIQEHDSTRAAADRILTHINVEEAFNVPSTLIKALPKMESNNINSINKKTNDLTVKIGKEQLIIYSLNLQYFMKEHDTFKIMLNHLSPNILNRIDNITISENYEKHYFRALLFFTEEKSKLFLPFYRQIISKLGHLNTLDASDPFFDLLPDIIKLNAYYRKNGRALTNFKLEFLKLQESIKKNNFN